MSHLPYIPQASMIGNAKPAERQQRDPRGRSCHPNKKLRTPLSGGSSLCKGMGEGCCTQPYPCICYLQDFV